MRMGSEGAATLLRRFNQLQEERVQTYTLFEQGYQAYLSGAPHYNFPMYRQLVYEITQTFKKISDDIIDIETKLRDEYKLSTLVGFIAKVQDEERTKLELTAKLQLAKQNVVDCPDNASHQQECTQLKNSMTQVAERITEHLEELKYESEDIVQPR